MTPCSKRGGKTYVVSDRMMIRPVSKMLGAMERIREGDLTVRLPEKASSADIEFMNKRFNLMVTEIKELRIKSYEQEIEKLKTDAINLKLQVDPHMFLNCLNVMYSLGRTGRTEQVCDFSVQLMNYFRYSLRSDAEFSSLREELNFVTSYLNIQKVRFPDRFTYSFDIQKEAESIQIPRLLVENFVENVVKYAMRCDGITHILILSMSFTASKRSEHWVASTRALSERIFSAESWVIRAAVLSAMTILSV